MIKIKKELKRLKKLIKKKYGVKIEYNVEWISSTSTIGQYRHTGRCLMFNKYVYNQVEFDEFRETIIHEFAHAAVMQIKGNVQPHGPEWKKMMRFLGAKEIKSTTAKFNDIKKKPTDKFAYCKCKKHVLSKYKYKKINSYKCTKCGSKLKKDNL